MTYSPNKPDAGPAPSIDAAQIQADFSQFATIFAINHMALNRTSQGDHKYVVFNAPLTPPTVNEAETVLFSNNATSQAGTQPQLFAKIPKFLPTAADTKDSLNDPMQLTYNTVDLAGPQYQSFLPGGYLLIFGTDTGNTVPSVKIQDQITLTTKPTTLVSVLAIPYTLTTSSSPTAFDVSVTIDAKDKFTIYSTGNGSRSAIPYSFGWLAIGKI